MLTNQSTLARQEQDQHALRDPITAMGRYYLGLHH